MRRLPQRECRSAFGRRMWSFPLSRAGVTAQLIFRGPTPETADIHALKRYIELVEVTFDQAPLLAATSGDGQPEELDPILPGDIVQIRPSADATFGGLMLRVRRTTPWNVQGYLLVPHRAGAVWMKFKSCELGRIGAIHWPEAEWGFNGNQVQERSEMWWREPKEKKAV